MLVAVHHDSRDTGHTNSETSPPNSIMAISFGLILAWAKDRCRPPFGIAAVLVGFSVAVQGLGIAVYPSSWNAKPGK